MRMWYNFVCIDEQNTGALCFLDTAAFSQSDIVGKVPLRCGLTSSAVRLCNGSAPGGHFAMAKLIALTRGRFAIVDDDDYEELNKYKWNCNSDNYANRRTKNKIVKMHRVILGAKEGDICDHINMNKLDNRKSNLRLVTKAQNGQNHGLYSHNKSGVNGVSFDKEANKWRVIITAYNQMIRVGRYKTLEEAREARRLAEEKYWGIT